VVGLEARTRLQVELDLAERGTAIARWLPRAEWSEVSSRRILTRHRLGAGPWSEWSTARSARLTGLAPGSHLLSVEALGAHGLAEPVRVSRSLTVPRPVWRRPEVVVPNLIGVVLVLGLLFWSTLRWLRESRAHREAMERFRQLADNVRDVFWLVDWRTGEALYFNPAYEAVVGVPVAEALANPRLWLERLHPDDRDWVAVDYRRAIDTVGEWDAEFRFLRRDGALTWVHARAFGIRDASGAIARVAGIAEEITDRRTSEARQQRLSLELDHRVKNVLAQVVAIADQSVARAEDLASFSRAFVGRIRSMARTHEALAANRWDSVPLRRVIETALGANAGDGRCDLDGPDVELSPRGSSSLGLALHELGTNAAKYGALAVPSGCVTVRWSVDASRIVRLSWREEGGAPVKPPRRSGLGLSLVRGLVEHDLGGVVEVRFEAAGLVCELEAPGVVTRIGRDVVAPAPLPSAPRTPAEAEATEPGAACAEAR